MTLDPTQLNALVGRMVMPEAGGFSPEHARYVLSLDFPPDQHALAADLSTKAQDGALTADEQRTLDALQFVDTMLAILQAKARVSLAKQSTHQPAA